MPEEAVIGGEDAEGVAAVVDGVGLFVQAVGGEEDIHAVTGGAIVFGIEVKDLVCHEDEV